MEETRSCHFHADMIYDLNTHKESQSAFQYTSVVFILMNLFMILLMGYVALKHEGRSFAFISLAGCAAFSISYLIARIRNRNGGVVYQRALYQHGGKAPHMQLSFEDEGIRSVNVITGNDQIHPYDRVLSLTETKHLLMIHLELKLFLAIDKRTLEGGSVDQLISFLRARCPRMKRRVQKGFLGQWTRNALYAIMIACALHSTAILLDIPAKLSGQITNSMTYLEIAEKLEPLGITGATAEMKEALDEYFGAYYTGFHADYYNKATDLLAVLGMGTYDEQTWEWIPSSNGVYWLDTEVYAVESMYTDFLRGIAALDPEVLSFTEITEDHTNVDFMSGTGTVDFSFCLNGTPYSLQIPFYTDWIDTRALGEIAAIVNSAHSELRLYFASDEGQGLIVFYRTERWAEEFTDLTRIPLYESPELIWYE